MHDLDQEQAERQAQQVDDREERQIKFGGRVLYAAKNIPAGMLLELSAITPDSPGVGDIGAMIRAVRMMLEPESVQDFEDAMLGVPFEVQHDDGSVAEVSSPVPDLASLNRLVEILAKRGTGRPLASSQASVGPSRMTAPGRLSRGGSLRTVGGASGP